MNKLSSLSDVQLLEKWALENELIFTEIYNRYWDKLLSIAYNRLNDLYDAEECVQDVFCKFWALRNNFELKGVDLNNYLSQAIRNQIFTVLRQRYRLREKKSDLPTEDDINYLTPEKQLIINELNKLFDQAVNALPKQCKLVYQLRQEEGLSIHEISEKLNISSNTVKFHLKKAKRDLRNNTKILTTLVFLVTIFQD